MSDDPAQEYFSDGISEDLITDLAKISGIMVIARNSSFIYRGTSNDVLSVAKNLGVRYVLEGSVRKAADRVRINAQLIDSQTGGHIWTDRYDGDLSDVFTVQDDITARIVSALELRLTEGEEAQIAAAETRSHEAYDAVLRGFEHFRKYSPDDFAVAESLFEQAIAIDPGYSRAYAALAAIYWEAWKRDWHISTGFWGLGWEKANGYLKRALENPTPLAHQISAQMLTVNRRYEEAILAARRATALAPNDALGYVALADALIYAGEPASAIPLISEAMELDPHVPAASLTVLGRAQYSLGMYEAAANTLEDAHSRNPNNQDPLVILAATYGQLAQEQEAAWTISMIDSLRKERRRGKLSIDSLRNQMPFKEVTDRDRLLEGLRRAGVPDW
jgi:TolB-like protein